jgi:uncharacterized DUF497 family protein
LEVPVAAAAAETRDALRKQPAPAAEAGFSLDLVRLFNPTAESRGAAPVEPHAHDQNALFEQDQTGDETGEVRWRAIGLVEGMVVVLVVHTVREEGQGEAIRLISARRATRKERNRYEQTRAQDLG